MVNGAQPVADHSHVFLGEEHRTSERRTWAVIWLCAATMVAEIVGGWLFGSIALIADGFHMSTHAGALLLAALAYTFARRYANDARFTFGTGKFGDLAGFTNAILLGMIALGIGYESLSRLLAPAPIRFAEAVPIACLGLAVNIASAWLLSGGGHAHSHDDGREHVHDAAGRDNNMRAAIVHVIADAAVSVLVIVGLLLAWAFGWRWTDPAAGVVGAIVIASWTVTLIRATGAVLLDMNPAPDTAAKIRSVIERDGDRLADLHLWRLGPGCLGAIVCVVTTQGRSEADFRAKLAPFHALAHLTIEVRPAA